MCAFSITCYNKTKLLDNIESLKIQKCLMCGDVLSIIADDGEHNFSFDKITDSFEEKILEIDCLLDFYNKLIRVFNFYNIDLNIELGDISENDVNKILILYDVIFNGTTCVNSQFIYNICELSFLNFYFLLYNKRIDNNKYKLIDFFKLEDKVVKINNELSSNYFILTINYPNQNLLLKYCNLNLDKMVDDIINSKTDSFNFYLRVNSISMQLIDLFDKLHNTKALELAMKLNTLIDSPKLSSYKFINKCQIDIRNNQLSKESIETLIKMEKETNDNCLLCSIALCLNCNAKFEYYYSKMSIGDQNKYRLYPIYRLFVK